MFVVMLIRLIGYHSVMFFSFLWGVCFCLFVRV